MTEYKKLTDEELIRRLRMGETGIIDYLMEKYKDLVRRKARSMHLPGAGGGAVTSAFEIEIKSAVPAARQKERKEHENSAGISEKTAAP